MKIESQIELLLQYAIYFNLIEEEDYNYSRNKLMELLKTNKISEEKFKIGEDTKISQILKPILDYAIENKLITDDTTSQRDKFEAKIMGLLIARPSVIIERFYQKKNKLGIEHATNWYYEFSKRTNYIITDRIAKNISWKSETEFGNIEVTINLSKPEKDPKEIASASNFKSSGYPKCILCTENEGYQGDAQLPARQNHRIIPIELVGEKWFFQYSPYVYFNEHSIILSEEHRPMKIDKITFLRLLKFVEQFPHYFIGSNADLPIVGGSILSHDHFQAGRHNFPMANSEIEYSFENKFNDVEIGIVKWKMSVIRLINKNIDKIVEIADIILNKWKKYFNSEIDIFAFTDETPHNTITPIARFKEGKYELDLVLRNNRTTEEYPDGIFHPHADLHHIKKENIGLIEVMGLAILPGRLLDELKLIENNFTEFDSSENLCSQYSELLKHKDWIDILRKKYQNIEKSKVSEMLKYEVSHKFLDVLGDSGVFKRNEDGKKAFIDFVDKCLK